MEHGSAECSCMKSSSSRQPTRWGVKLGDGRKKQVLAVKLGERSLGCPLARPIQEKITARLDEKARFGRKIGGRLLGFAPGLPLSRGNYGQISEKSKIWP